MPSRVFQVAIVMSWLGAMSWLVSEKIAPVLSAGDPPELTILPDQEPEAVCWQMLWRGRRIGWAATKAIRHNAGGGEVYSLVYFEDLPLDRLLEDLLGSLGPIFKPLLGTGPDQLDHLVVRSRTYVGPDDRVMRFVTNVRMADLGDFMRLEGFVEGNTLKLVVRSTRFDSVAGDEQSEMRILYRNELELSPDTLVSDALSPRTRLTNLHVGQTWNTSVYRPFPPHSPVEVLQAQVERKDLLVWAGETVQAWQVVYRSEAGSGLQAGRAPVGRLWVKDDGTVLEQEVRAASLQVKFVRLPESQCESHLELLDEMVP